MDLVLSYCVWHALAEYLNVRFALLTNDYSGNLHLFFMAKVFFFVSLLSTLDIFRHCRRHLESLPLLQKPVGDLPLGTWAREVGGRSNRLLLTLRASDPLSSALNLLIQGANT